MLLHLIKSHQESVQDHFLMSFMCCFRISPDNLLSQSIAQLDKRFIFLPMLSMGFSFVSLCLPFQLESISHSLNRNLITIGLHWAIHDIRPYLPSYPSHNHAQLHCLFRKSDSVHAFYCATASKCLRYSLHSELPSNLSVLNFCHEGFLKFGVLSKKRD